MLFGNPNKNTLSKPKITKVKICGISDLTVIPTLIEYNVDAIGLMFYEKSCRYATLDKAIKIAETVNEQMDIIGVFVNPSLKYVNNIINNIPLSGIQFHGKETFEFCNSWNIPWIKAIHVDAKTDLNYEISYWQKANACLLDTKTENLFGGTGAAFNWNKIPNNHKNSIILAGGINHNNINDAIKNVNPFAIDISSGVESKPGVKSTSLIINLMTKIKNIQK